MLPVMAFRQQADVSRGRICRPAERRSWNALLFLRAIELPLEPFGLAKQSGFRAIRLQLQPSQKLKDALPAYATQPGGDHLPIVCAVDCGLDSRDGRGLPLGGNDCLGPAQRSGFLRLAGLDVVPGACFHAILFQGRDAARGETGRTGVLPLFRAQVAAGIPRRRLGECLGHVCGLGVNTIMAESGAAAPTKKRPLEAHSASNGRL